MRRLVVAVFCLLSVSALGQEVQRYKGFFYNGLSYPAEAIYNYYDKGGKKIYHGNFRYVVDGKDKNGKFYQNISGKYVDGNRNDKWSSRMYLRDHRFYKDAYYYTGNFQLKSAYNNGQPNGRWTYEGKVKRRKALSSKGGHTKFDRYEPETKTNVLLKFKNGVLTDTVSYTDNKGNKVFGVIDEGGRCHGTWIFKNKTESRELTFYHGLVTKWTFKDASGTVKDQGENTDIRADFEKYESIKRDKPAELKGLNYSFTTHHIQNYMGGLLKKLLAKSVYNPDFFMYHVIPGDKAVKKGKSKINFNFEGGKYYQRKGQVSTGESSFVSNINRNYRVMGKYNAKARIFIENTDYPADKRKIAMALNGDFKRAEVINCLANAISKGQDNRAGIIKSVASCKEKNNMIKLKSYNSKQEALKELATMMREVEVQARAKYKKLLQ